MPSRDEELALLFRGIFLPEEGEVWAKPDRVATGIPVCRALRQPAQIAQCRLKPWRAIAEDPDADFHAFAATITGLDRSAAKAVNFAKMYGAGVTKFARDDRQAAGGSTAALCPVTTATCRSLHLLSKIYTRRAHAQGYITLYDGARRHFDKFAPGGKWKKGAGPCSHEEALERIKDPKHPWYGRGPLYRADTKNAMNALIQGGAARHTKLGCGRAGATASFRSSKCTTAWIARSARANKPNWSPG